MTEQEPRQWSKNSEEPPADVKLHDADGDILICGSLGLWRYATVHGRVTATSDADGCPWVDLDDEFDVAWPLTEVLAPPLTAARESECLPGERIESSPLSPEKRAELAEMKAEIEFVHDFEIACEVGKHMRNGTAHELFKMGYRKSSAAAQTAEQAQPQVPNDWEAQIAHAFDHAAHFQNAHGRVRNTIKSWLAGSLVTSEDSRIGEIRAVLAADTGQAEWLDDAVGSIRRILDRPGSPVTETTKQDGGRVRELVEASLQHDYTVDRDCPEYADDDAEYTAALANIAEMHRLLNVRAERLAEAYEEIAGAESMAIGARDFNARQIEALHQAIADAVGWSRSEPWPGNRKAFEALSALRKESEFGVSGVTSETEKR